MQKKALNFFLHLIYYGTFFTAACYTQGVLFRSRKERQIAVL